MKTFFKPTQKSGRHPGRALVARLCFIVCCGAAPLLAQQPNNPSPRPPAAARTTGDYATDIAVVTEAQQQALAQARELLAQGENVRDRAGLELAIKEMERAQAALAQAGKSPEKLPAALAAAQSAYQALMKITPREFRMTQSQNRGQGSAGQPNQRQLDQLEMKQEENRYETERQAAAAPTAKQREQSQTAERLKELSQRQQDLNDRLRELQNALQAARTEPEREEIQRQLKRLRDEERQMLADVDELRQQLERSPNASSQAETREQLDQTRSDLERAAREMERESASQALAAGTRAEQRLQNLREDLRRQTASEFSEQMRQLRNQARDLARQEEEVARQLDSLENGNLKSLDDSARRQQVVDQMSRQQSALTNLLAGMRTVTEQAESTEPLLSRQLYDTLRRADQMHTDNLLEMSTQLASRGFIPQAGEAERSARTNINELRQSVEHAAESVLGNEAEAIRYAQRELDDLTRQVEREMAGTNSAALAAGRNSGAQNQSNRLARAEGNSSVENSPGNPGANSRPGPNENSAGSESASAGNNPPRQQHGEKNPTDTRQNGDRGERANGNGNNGEQASGETPPSGQGETTSGNNPGQGNRADNNQSAAAENNSSPSASASSADDAGGGGGGARGGGNRLRQLVEQLGADDRQGGEGGPISGNNYVNWSDRLRDVERVLDPQDLRNQLATVRERVAAFRTGYREGGRVPDANVLRSQVLTPMTQVRVWLQQELARQENSGSLVPLDRDPVPDNYSELVRKYYEKLGSAQ
jgi:hypothetical protein